MLLGVKSINHPRQIAKRLGEVDTATDDRETPPRVWRPLNALYRFTLDVAASVDNAKCARYFTLEESGLRQSWREARVWCNPPYSNCAAWVSKAWHEMRDGGCELAALLLPANRTEQRWWQLMVEPYRDKPPREGIRLTCRFLSGRPAFRKPGQAWGDACHTPFGAVLLVWEREPNGSASNTARPA